LTSHIFRIGTKGADLVSRSTIIQIIFFFEAKKGNSMTKSIEIKGHFQVESFKGLSLLRHIDIRLYPSDKSNAYSHNL